MFDIQFSSRLAPKSVSIIPIYAGDSRSELRQTLEHFSPPQKKAILQVLQSSRLPHKGHVPVYSAQALVLLFIIGKKTKTSRRDIRERGEEIFSLAKRYHLEELTIFSGSLSEENVRAFHEGIILGSYEFLQFKTKKNDNDSSKNLKKIVFFGAKNTQEHDWLQALENSTRLTKDLVNLPPMAANPSYVVSTAEKIAKKYKKVSIKIFEMKELEKLGFGGIVGVGKAGEEKPSLIILHYEGGKRGEAPIALIGKGVTYDTGGLNIKTMSMRTMKQDIAGAATVLGAFEALVLMGIQKNIIVVIPTAENAISEESYRPDDVLTMYNGKTVEVTNTDAEGRLLLADALSYTEKNWKPRMMLTIATLTGCCNYAVGHDITAILGNNKTLMETLKNSALAVDEPVWELPLHEQYKKYLKSNIADLVNSTKKFRAGTIEGGLFLENFVSSKMPWCHLDIASVAFGDVSEMATGRNVRLLIDFVKRF
ncbi:leucyl aminopeptidase family protein [Candidatus Peregrinibacteria bacterium]|nr:leucyl aminopeptidase family protein [Candidatus Peregrinibacteria bacterium]